MPKCIARTVGINVDMKNEIQKYLLKDIAAIIAGQSPESKYYNTNGEGIPFFQGKADFGALYPNIRTYCSQPIRIAEKDDILLSVRAPVGPTNLSPGKVCIGRGLTAIRPGSSIRLKYLLYFFRYYEAQLQKSGTGTTFKAITQNVIKNIEVPVPSLDEQERIVSKIEELFSKLDASVAELKTAKEKLKVYRQAVLKEAFDKASSSNSKEMTIDSLLTKTRKGMSTGPFGTMLKKFEHQRAGVPVLGIENIGEGKFVPGNKIFVTPEKATELQAFRVHTGDIIISRSGTVGELCIVPPYMENSLLSTNLMRISLDFEIVLPTYFVYLFRSKGVVVDQVKELCKGSTRMFLNQTILKQIRFPIPSIPAQQKLVNMVESRLSICDNIEQTIDTSLQQAEAMRQSILKQAFEGRLL